MLYVSTILGRPPMLLIRLPNFLLPILFCLFYSPGFSQENYFENIEISPATCQENNGTITVDLPPTYIEFYWQDGTNELNREQLAPGMYTLIGEDEEGCIEEIILEIPDISDCDLNLAIWERPNIPDNERSAMRPCVTAGFNFTLNGIPVPFENLNILWTITIPVPYPPYFIISYSTEPFGSRLCQRNDPRFRSVPKYRMGRYPLLPF